MRDVPEAQLINKDNPEVGLFIAESPKVIGRALDVDYIPVSVLVEKHQMEENEETRRILTRFEDTDVPIFTAEFEVLTKLTGFMLTRGMLCAMKRKPLLNYSGYVCRKRQNSHFGKCNESDECRCNFPGRQQL